MSVARVGVDPVTPSGSSGYFSETAASRMQLSKGTGELALRALRPPRLTVFTVDKSARIVRLVVKS